MKEFQVGNTGGVQRPIGDRTPKTKEQASTNNLSDISVWLENPNTRSKFDTNNDGKIDAGKEADFKAFVKEQKRLEHNFKAMFFNRNDSQRRLKDWTELKKADYDALRMARAAGGLSNIDTADKNYAKARANEIKQHLEAEIKIVKDPEIKRDMDQSIGAAGIQFLQLYQKGLGKTPDGKEETYEKILKDIKQDFGPESTMTAKQLAAKYGCQGYDAALEKYFLGPITNDYQQFVETRIEQAKLAGREDLTVQKAALNQNYPVISPQNIDTTSYTKEYSNFTYKDTLTTDK